MKLKGELFLRQKEATMRRFKGKCVVSIVSKDCLLKDAFYALQTIAIPPQML